MRQAIAKAIVAFYQKYVDEQSKREVKVRGGGLAGETNGAQWGSERA